MNEEERERQGRGRMSARPSGCGDTDGATKHAVRLLSSFAPISPKTWTHPLLGTR